MIRLPWMRARKRTRGQTLVEFALVLPIFILMLFGLVDMGRLVYANSTLSQAARESARLAAVEAYWVGSSDPSCNQPGGPVCSANEATMRTHVLTAANRMMTGVGTIAAGNLHIACTSSTAATPSGAWTSPPYGCGTAATRQPGSHVSVRVAMTFQPITPILSQIITSLNLSGSATMVVN